MENSHHHALLTLMPAAGTDIHSLLQRQLKKHVRLAGEIPPDWRALVQAVDSAYRQSDADRQMLERSLECSARPLTPNGRPVAERGKLAVVYRLYRAYRGLQGLQGSSGATSRAARSDFFADGCILPEVIVHGGTDGTHAISSRHRSCRCIVATS